MPSIMKIDKIYNAFLQCSSITTDTRNCPDNSMFFALKGANFNGNLYAARALDLGCSYVVVDEEVECDQSKCFLVDDVLATLQQLANHHRKQLGTKIIGITGSNGKTTTKELLATALAPKFNLFFTQGNFNNHIGVPLTLLQLKEEHELAIVEMGANHPFEIEALCKIAEPDLGVITNIGKAHLEGFGGIEGVIKTKKELYDFIKQNNGKVFVNGQDELLMSLSEDIERLIYNTSDSTYTISVKEVIPTLTLEVETAGESDVIVSQLVGEYNVINVAVALEIGAYLGVDYVAMKDALEAYVSSNNRSQVVETDSNTIILDAYNANPASMAVALENFAKVKADNKVVLLGAMKELGEYSIAEHQLLADEVSELDATLKVLVGGEFDPIEKTSSDIIFLQNAQEVSEYLEQRPVANSTILIKGSRSMKMETLVDCL